LATLPNFVLGSEGSSADCGLLITDGTLPTMKVTDRLSAARKKYGENTLARNGRFEEAEEIAIRGINELKERSVSTQFS
jgi:hypothetical protein